MGNPSLGDLPGMHVLSLTSPLVYGASLSIQYKHTLGTHFAFGTGQFQESHCDPFGWHSCVLLHSMSSHVP